MLKSKYDEYRALARRGERIVDEVVEQYAKALDDFVESTDAILDELREKNKTMDDRLLERMVMKLPVIMYRLGDMIDRAAIESDIAKAVLKSARAQAYLDKEGTIPEREAQADLQSMDESVIVDLSKHVYTRLKSKLEHSSNLFDGIRKVMSTHDVEKQIFGKSRAT